MKEQREKGICSNCDEKYRPNHQCTTQNLYLLNIDLLKDLVVEANEIAVDEVENELENINYDTLEIYFNSLLGFSSLQTMKYHGYFK